MSLYLAGEAVTTFVSYTCMSVINHIDCLCYQCVQPAIIWHRSIHCHSFAFCCRRIIVWFRSVLTRKSTKTWQIVTL